MTCNWPVDRSCLPTAQSDVDQLKQESAENLAVSVLWALSGRQFGQCPVIIRPCPTPCTEPSGAWLAGPGWFPIFESGSWRNISCGCSASGCNLYGPAVIHLPGPVGVVTEVVMDGVTLPADAYVLEGEVLRRADGSDWPSQNLQLPLGRAGTWSITYTQGYPPPPGVAVFVGTLAKEFLDACSGKPCRLPKNTQSVSRRGVSYQMYDPSSIYASGKTGISEIDLWLQSVNPNRLMSAPRVR